MRNFKFFALALLCVLGVVFSGCNNDAGIVDDSFGLSFTLPDGKTERSVFYDISEVASYEINVSQNGYTVTTKTASPGDTVKIKLTDLGDYDILVTAKNAGGTTIAKGTARVTFVTGDTGYKNVVIDIEPEEKTVGVKVTAAWETPGAEKYGADDAVRYDVTVYEGEKLVGQFENVSVLNTTYTVYIPYYSTYTVKVEAKKPNLTVVGSGSGSVTLSKGDVYKNLSLSLTIVGEDNIASGEVGIDAQINWVEGYRRETVEFGSWPQSLADVTGITLTETGKTYDNHPEYSASDGNKYVKVNDSYYKVEPITWRVIAYNSDGSKKLLADKIYTSVAYYENTSTRALDGKPIYPNNYKYSNIRAYLNSSKNQFVKDGGTASSDDLDWTDKGFYSQAFTEAEKAKIKTVLVDNSAPTTSSDTNQYACENTEDRVYLLSYKESQKKLYGLGSNAERIMMPTEYAKANGAFQDITEDYGGYWWLRSPIYGSSIYASYISPDGGHRGSDDGGVYWTSGGVVPALSVTE